MNKAALFKALEAQCAADLASLTQAAVAAHLAATHVESKAEDQYDTRGLEASYLAGAQSKRTMELQEVVDQFRHLDIKAFGPTTPIAATAVVAVECDGVRSHYLLMPKGGGRSIQHEGKTIHVVTPQSPMGSALLARKVNDEIEVHVAGQVRDYQIVAVW